MLLLQKIVSFWLTRIIFFVVLLFCSFIVSVLVFGLDDKDREGSLMSSSFILLICSAIIEVLRKGGKWYLFGFSASLAAIKEFIAGKFLAFSSLGLIALVGILINTQLSVHDTTYHQFFDVVQFYFFVAFIEELLFRGIVFQAILDRFGEMKATLIFSVLFGCAHLFNPNIELLATINIILAGICLSFMYIRTRSLWMPIAFHWVWNFCQEFMLGSQVSGYKSNPSFSSLNWEVLNNKAPLLFGGSFGIEGGLLTTFVLLITLYITISFFQPSPYIIARLFRRKFAEDAL